MGLKDALLYVLSLPERAVRSVSAAVGGVTKLMTDTLLPRSVRGLTVYKYFVGNTQKFLIESLGEVKTESGEKLPDDYLARKVVGNVVDAAGIFALHFSPVWFFALVSDAAGGGKEYLHRVVAELEKDGAIPPGSKVESADRLFDALTDVCSKSAAPLDAPPISKEELKKLQGEIGASYADLYRTSKASLPSLDSLWEGLMEIRRREKLPLLKLSGAMSFAATRAVGRATGALFAEKVVGSYAASLAEVKKEGFTAFFSREAKPYIDAVTGAFSLSRKTFTQRLLGG
jgi:hypothetical protein